MDMKRFFLYAIAIAALALAGCGGNGGNGVPGTPPGTPPSSMLSCGAGTMEENDECVPTVPTGMANATAAAYAPAIAKPAAGMVFDGMLDRDNPGGVLTVDGNKVTHDTAMPEFEMATDMPDILDLFNGSRHTRTAQEAVMADPDADPMVAAMPGIVDTVTVYTDVEVPTMTLFTDVYMLTGGGAGTEADPYTELTPGDTDLMILTENVPPMGTTGMFDLADDETIAGTYGGAEGMYRCDGGTCAVTLDDDGKPMDVSSLVFDPADGAMVPVADDDYLSFGYWVQATTTTDDEGETSTSYKVAAFADGEMEYLAGQIANLAGQATYTGEAAGLYVQKTDVHGDGKGLVPTSTGQFRADVDLTATFGMPGTVGSVHHEGISGTVENFVNSAGDDLGWTLNLMKAAITNGSNEYMGTTSGGEDMPMGGWEGRFFGSSDGEPEMDGMQPAADDTYPTSTAGRFNGHFDGSDDGPVGHVIGGFGANLDE